MNAPQLTKLMKDGDAAVESFIKQTAEFCSVTSKKKILIVIDPECKLGFDIRVSLNGYSSMLSIINFKSVEEAKEFENTNRDNVAAVVSNKSETIRRAKTGSIPAFVVSGNIKTMQQEIVDAIGLVHA